MLLTGIIAFDAKHTFLLTVINNHSISKSYINNEEYHLLECSSRIQHTLTYIFSSSQNIISEST